MEEPEKVAVAVAQWMRELLETYEAVFPDGPGPGIEFLPQHEASQWEVLDQWLLSEWPGRSCPEWPATARGLSPQLRFLLVERFQQSLTGLAWCLGNGSLLGSPVLEHRLLWALIFLAPTVRMHPRAGSIEP